MEADPKQELIHDYPADLKSPWKENWYFSFVDRKSGVWGINHVSLMRQTQKGRFSCVHVVDGQILPYSNLLNIKDDMNELTDGKLKFEFVEPFNKFRVTFNGPRHRLEADFEATTPPCFYDKPKQDKNHALSVNHYRQGLYVRGKIEFKGETRSFEGHCDRDHTWGYRDEGGLTGWNWVGAYFPDRTVNFARILTGKSFFGSGYIMTKDGHTKMVKVAVHDTRFEKDAPVSSVFTGYDGNGKPVARIKSENFFSLRLPMVDKEGVTIFENFAEFTDLDTMEKGDGVDEYLINPKEKYYCSD